MTATTSSRCLIFPTDFARSTSQSGESAFMIFTSTILDAERSVSLKSLCASLKHNLSAFFLACISATIHCSTGQTEGTIYIPSQDRSETLRVIDVNYCPTWDLETCLSHLNKPTAVEHGEASLLVSYNVEPTTESLPSSIDSCWHFFHEATDGSLKLRVRFRAHLFDQASMASYVAILQRVIGAYMDHPSQTVPSVLLCTAADLGWATRWNTRPLPNEFTKFNTIGDVITSVAKRLPTQVAILHDDTGFSITFQELDFWSDNLAQWLLRNNYGGSNETIVGIWQTRTAFLVVSFLGCMKAGCAYMPLETALPAERIRTMLQDASSPLVLGYAPAFEFPCSNDARFVDLATSGMQETLHSVFDGASIRFPELAPHRLSSLIFTSGTTGVPKGIMIQQNCLLNFLDSSFMHVQEGDRASFILSIASDVSSGEIWFPLARGATLVCYTQPAGAPYDIVRLGNLIAERQLSAFNAPTAIVKSLIEVGLFQRELPNLRYISMGGEAVTLELVNAIQRAQPSVTLVNSYGPSESTIFSSMYVIPPGYQRTTVPIGQPPPGIEAYVADEDLNLVAPGVCGELLLAGRGLARGYLNRPELTSTKFVHFPEHHPLHSLRVYRTGDIVRINPEGELDFISRRDDGQIKLRGQRIELGEIEVAIQGRPGIRQAVVVVCKLPDEERLLGYFTSVSPDAEIDTESVLSHLKTLLPSYMVPSSLYRLAEIPLGLTGKVDRKRLSDPTFVDSLRPASPILEESSSLDSQQLIIRDVFAHALGRPSHEVPLTGNLFDLGGHSLTAVRILVALKRKFAISLDMTSFMANASVEGITRLLEGSAAVANTLTIIPRLADTHDRLAASDAQSRMWVEEEMNPGLDRYNVVFQRRLLGPMNNNALKQAIFVLAERHETLRTTFSMDGGVLYQQILPSDRIPIQFITLSDNRTDWGYDLHTILAREASKPFDLTRETPSRFCIIKSGEDVHHFSCIIHHIATDGWSMGVIEQELAIIYNALSRHIAVPLPPLPLRYRDYATWQRRHVDKTQLDQQLGYWKAQLEGAVPIELFSDFVRPDKLSGKAKEIEFTIPQTTLLQLREFAAKHSASLYVVLLSAFRAALFRSSGATDGNVGMVNASRSAPELEPMVGFFANTHAIRLAVEEKTTFEQLLTQTKRVVIEALEHADVPFDKVVAHLAPKRDISRNPLVQLLFILQDFSGVLGHETVPQMDGITAEDIRTPSTRLDLSIHMFIHGDSLKGHAMYQTDLFTHSTVQSFVDVFLSILKRSIENPTNPLSTLQLMDAGGLQNLRTWNQTSTLLRETRSLGDRFREVAMQFGSSIAVVDETTSLTYAQLNERSNRLASWLAGRKIPREGAVGVWMGRSVLLVTAYLACVKAGLAYMPLDKGLPVARLRQMISASDCSLVLAAGKCPLENEVACADLSEYSHILTSTPFVKLPVVQADSLSNIIFTSGSTGAPKGVMVEHRGMLNLCSPETSAWSTRSRNALTSGIGFDPSGFQIFSTLLSGSELHCLSDNGVFDVDVCQRFLITSRVQRCYLTPSVLATLLHDGSEWLKSTSLEHLMLGGEKLQPSVIAECTIQIPHLSVWSSYGPAEASVRSAFHIIPSSLALSHQSRVPLGRALPNTQISVVDPNLEPVPPGVVGEIVVSGVHVTRGYVNQEDLTRQKFIELPLNHHLSGGQRLYRTGDLGFWSSDGLLQYIGRVDNQLKLRGQRLEAGEIESLINRHPAIKNSAVVIPDIEGHQQLVAYIQLKEDDTEKDVLDLWDAHYNAEDPFKVLEDSNAGHDFARWFSMFTGDRIPFEEMQEWLDDTLQQISPHPQDRVMEIGCGTGMIALGIINTVASYVGSDISAPSVAFLQTQAAKRGLSSKLFTCKAAAHETITNLPHSGITLGIINSVAQYFPSAEYLTEVIQNTIPRIASGGRFFIGDIRSHALIRLHDIERALGSSGDKDTVSDIQSRVAQYSQSQAELLVSPSFFYSLQRKIPRIAHVEIRPKLMKTRNELSRYRYSVILHIDNIPELLTPSRHVDYSADSLTLVGLRSELRMHPNASVKVSNIPLPDLEVIDTALQFPNDTPVSALAERLAQHRSTNFSMPYELSEMAKEEGWHVLFDYSHHNSQGGNLAAIFYRNGSHPHSLTIGAFDAPPSPKASYNVIRKAEVDQRRILSSVKSYLQQFLPESIVPNTLVAVTEIPLNRSGKLDRRGLSSAEFFHSHVDTVASSTRQGPRNETDTAVLQTFADALHLDPATIDIRHSLFDMGGHSLMATLVVNAIRKSFNVEISTATFFKRPTVIDVSNLIASNSSQQPSQKEDPIDAMRDAIFANSDLPGPTLFLFPETTGFGSVYSSAFSSLAYPVVAFGDPRWGQDLVEGETIPGIASHFVAKILEIQPTGPFHLAGWSFGGYVAFEIATQLQILGKSVALLLMLDSNVYNRPLSSSPKWDSSLDHLLQIVPEQECWLNQFRRINTLVSNYRPLKDAYKGKSVLVKAQYGRADEDGDDLPVEDPHNGWLTYLPQLEVHTFPSTHRKMFNRLNGKEIGNLMTAIISETPVKPS